MLHRQLLAETLQHLVRRVRFERDEHADLAETRRRRLWT